MKGKDEAHCCSVNNNHTGVHSLYLVTDRKHKYKRALTYLAGKDMLGQAVGGVHVQQLNLAGLHSWVLGKAGLPPHVSCVQNDLQNGTAISICDMFCTAML